MMSLRFYRVAGLACACLWLAGCGGEKVPELGKVTGTVTLDGEPVPRAVVTFSPAKQRQSAGTTDDSGTYTLLFDARHQGAVVGNHKVTIVTLIGESGEEIKIPAKYNTESELTGEVASGDNIIDFELESK